MRINRCAEEEDEKAADTYSLSAGKKTQNEISNYNVCVFLLASARADVQTAAVCVPREWLLAAPCAARTITIIQIRTRMYICGSTCSRT